MQTATRTTYRPRLDDHVVVYRDTDLPFHGQIAAIDGLGMVGVLGYEGRMIWARPADVALAVW